MSDGQEDKSAIKTREMRLIRPSDVEELGSITTDRNASSFCRRAARATYNVTNLLLYAKMHGQRPLLVFIGNNAFSENWQRLYNFICSFHQQYGTLHIAVRMTLQAREYLDRAVSLKLLCPHIIDKQAFGFYDSHDFIRYSQGSQVPALKAWHTILAKVERCEILKVAITHFPLCG
jgi:hypothetical protein